MFCEKCGYKNDSFNKNCIGCGTVLKPVPSDEQLAELLNSLSDKSDPLTVSPFDKKIKWLFFVSAVVILTVTSLIAKNIATGIIAALPAVFAGITAGYLKVLWILDKFKIKTLTDVDTTPNDSWSVSRKIAYWILYGGSVVLMIILIYV